MTEDAAGPRLFRCALSSQPECLEPVLHSRINLNQNILRERAGMAGSFSVWQWHPHLHTTRTSRPASFSPEVGDSC